MDSSIHWIDGKINFSLCTSENLKINPFVTQFNKKIALIELSVHKEPLLLSSIWRSIQIKRNF